jgi:hypothetical protein
MVASPDRADLALAEQHEGRPEGVTKMSKDNADRADRAVDQLIMAEEHLAAAYELLPESEQEGRAVVRAAVHANNRAYEALRDAIR